MESTGDASAQAGSNGARDGRSAALLAWGEASRRDLPWRRTRDPWSVWVSEVMLQQTQVDRVVPKYTRFLAQWPTAAACADADLASILRLWSGLGYPRRAGNLHLAAQRVTSEHGGVVPRELDELLALPGIGPCRASGPTRHGRSWSSPTRPTSVWSTPPSDACWRVGVAGRYGPPRPR